MTCWKEGDIQLQSSMAQGMLRVTMLQEGLIQRIQWVVGATEAQRIVYWILIIFQGLKGTILNVPLEVCLTMPASGKPKTCCRAASYFARH